MNDSSNMLLVGNRRFFAQLVAVRSDSSAGSTMLWAVQKMSHLTIGSLLPSVKGRRTE